jgi:uncharacterized membrane protein
MSHLIVIVFDNPDEAAKVRETLKGGESLGMLRLDDSAVVVRDAEGKLHIHDEVDRGVKSGALWGSLIGLLIGGILFPIFGLALGAIGGAIIGKMAGDHVDPKFVKEVGASLTSGTSAIFYIFRGSDVNAAIASLRPYQGKVLHTTLSEEAEASLRDELKKRIT